MIAATDATAELTREKLRTPMLAWGGVRSFGSHFAATDDTAVTVLITGSGPTDTVYENPADDPTHTP